MIEVAAFILQSGITVSLSLAAGLVLLQFLGEPAGLKRYLWQGAFGSLIAGLSLAYPLKYFKLREEFDVILAGMTLILCVTAIICMHRGRRAPLKAPYVGGFADRRAILLFGIGFLLPLGHIVEMVYFPRAIFITSKTYLNTELILKVSAAFLAAGISIFIGRLFVRIGQFLDKKRTALLLTIFFISTAAHALIIALSGLLLLGFIPATTKTVAVIAPLINYNHVTFYALLFMVGVGLFLAQKRGHPFLWSTIDRKKMSVPFFTNPAEKRKARAAELNRSYWIRSGYAALLIIITIMVCDHIVANRKVGLSPAEKVTAEDGVVYIPISSTSGGKLYRFSFTAEKGTQIRFIVIEKRPGVFGVCYDACEICGPRGYYERKKGVIVCLACDVVMNLDTIGLPGGCNPIPLPYKKEKDALLIRVSDIEAREAKFRI